MFKTAMRLCARRGRSLRRKGPWPPVEPSGPDEMDRLLDRRAIVRALSVLSVRQRQAVVLRDWAGYETTEVAAMLGMRESTVRVHLARGRQALRAALRAEEGSEL